MEERLCERLAEDQMDTICLGIENGGIVTNPLPKDEILDKALEHEEWHRFLGLLRYWASRARAFYPSDEQLNALEAGENVRMSSDQVMTGKRFGGADKKYFNTVMVDLLGKWLPRISNVKKQLWVHATRNKERMWILREDLPIEFIEDTRTKLDHILQLIPEAMTELTEQKPGETKHELRLRIPKPVPLPSLAA